MVRRVAPEHLSGHSSRPRVGLYFWVGEELLIDAVEAEAGEPYNQAIQYGGHYEFWDRIHPKTAPERDFKAHGYDYFPRGRVSWFPSAGQMRVYADSCLSAAVLKELRAAFGIAGDIPAVIMIRDDEHYRCHRCNGEYLE